MKNMTELVIKIPEEQYRTLNATSQNDVVAAIDHALLLEAIKNGTPLPKGHKRLIEDNFKVGPIFDKEGNRVGYQYVTQEDLNNALTIIEADKKEGEE